MGTPKRTNKRTNKLILSLCLVLAFSVLLSCDLSTLSAYIRQANAWAWRHYIPFGVLAVGIVCGVLSHYLKKRGGA